MLDPDLLPAAAESLRRLLATVQAGEVQAGAAAVAHLQGSVDLLDEYLADLEAVREPDV